MRKAFGLLVLLLALAAATFAWEWWHTGTTNFLTLANARNQLAWIGLFGLLALAQCLVIITGGIDLSVGSVVALVGICAAMLLGGGEGWPVLIVLPVCLVLSAGIGAAHGVLVTRARLQPFVVTLCGLFIYRGIARYLTGDNTQGFGSGYETLRWWGRGYLDSLFYAQAPGEGASPLQWVLYTIPASFLVMLLTALGVGLLLHAMPFGRHLFALGANEDAARYSGVATDRLKLTAYVLCSVITGLAGLLLAFKINSMGPASFGNFYELYAIAGAVLGGCSLRGGTGNVIGVVLGIALIQILRNLVNILGISSQLEFAVIGGTILLGVLSDEWLTRRSAARAR